MANDSRTTAHRVSPVTSFPTPGVRRVSNSFYSRLEREHQGPVTEAEPRNIRRPSAAGQTRKIALMTAFPKLPAEKPFTRHRRVQTTHTSAPAGFASATPSPAVSLRQHRGTPRGHGGDGNPRESKILQQPRFQQRSQGMEKRIRIHHSDPCHVPTRLVMASSARPAMHSVPFLG